MITTRLKGKDLGIFLDDEALTTPRVQDVIREGRARITGRFTLEEARRLVAQLQGGELPVPLRVVEVNVSAGPLGQLNR